MTGTSKLKDPRTCRIFFSSPFGGMEEEREELTRKYFPQIHHLCNSRGIQFVAVDMRWGITSEAAENAQTVSICLRELDRCDIFVGFYGQRYGWHGIDNKNIQRNIDNAVGRYPWLEDFRDRSVTELEFVHGHLNNPGALPACICFRDKSYDEERASILETSGDDKGAKRYQSEGDEASRRLASLRDRIHDTRDKTLAVHMDYLNPKEGAKHMFTAIWEHLNNVMLTRDGDEAESERLLELADHHAFMASRQALYIGGDHYFQQLNTVLSSDITEKVVLVAEAGQGKSSLLANWVSQAQDSDPTAIIAYHFIGSSKDSSTKTNILKRLTTEITEALPEKKQESSESKTDDTTKSTDSEGKKPAVEDTGKNKGQGDQGEVTLEDTDQDSKGRVESSKEKEDGSKDKADTNNNSEDNKKKSEKSKDVREMMTLLMGELDRARTEGRVVVIVIDGLDKIEETFGKIAKPVSWLPDKIPDNVKIVVSVLDTEPGIIEELVTARKYRKITLGGLQLEDRTQLCEKTLKESGKELSKQQLQRIVDKDQTENALFLKIIIAELSVFGSFRKLDEKIDDLLTSNSIRDLCVKVLERLESDYNTAEQPDLVQEVLKLLQVSHEGLTETELKEILDLSPHVWSPLYFALEQYVVVQSGLISFAFSELGKAVAERYLNLTEDRSASAKCLISYFDKKRKAFDISPTPAKSLLRRPAMELSWLQKQIDDKDGLTTTLSDLLMFHFLVGKNEYELFELWKSTGHTFTDIADMYVKSFDKALVEVYCLEKDSLIEPKDRSKTPGQRLLFLLENVRFFMDMASCIEGSIRTLKRITQLLENLEGKWKEESQRLELLAEHQYYLACSDCDSGNYKRGEELHKKVMKYWRTGVQSGEIDKKLGEERMAWCYNGLGLTHYYQKQYIEGEMMFRDSLAIHEKHKNICSAADCWTNIGLIKLGLKKPKEAIKIFEEALRLYEEHYFDSVPHSIGNVYTNLALAYRRDNQLDQAEEFYQKSLELKINAVGSEHPIIATAYMNLGTLYMFRKNYLKVQQFTEKALHIYKINQLHGDHRSYWQCKENMANCLLKQNKIEEAEPYFWDVFDVQIRLGFLADCLPYVHHTISEHYINSDQFDKADRILTALSHCKERRRAKTFLLLDILDQKHPRSDVNPRPREETLEYGMELFPRNEDLFEQQVRVHHVARGDLEGLEEFLTARGAEAEIYEQVVDWCEEEGKPGIAAEVIDRALHKFPDNQMLIGKSVSVWCSVKQFEKALPLVQQLDSEGVHSDEVRLNCARTLHQCSENEAAYQWLKKLLTSIGSLSDEMKQEVEALKEKMDAEAKL
ncbi:TPR repeat-containing protein DDB_G0287407-like [Haliotis cracherodii]|uniref:TPR repeat-containing protein DDB_G0287407-like n=1 Tax=Haliotis cracherodii TaxID=6455 RepID=UPI0039E93AEB